VDKFLVESPFQPAGDQPKAIAQLAQGVEDGLRYQTLEGITGVARPRRSPGSSSTCSDRR